MGEMGARVRTFFIFALVGGAIAAAVACSSSDDSTFSDNGDGGQSADSAPISPLVPDSSASEGGDGSGPAQCTPKIPDNFKATWTPPTKNATACTADELKGYWDACLKDAAKKDLCTAYTDAHKTCAACIEPTNMAGPVQWHLDRLYYTLNIAGCIGLETGNTGATDCAGAYNAAVQCTRDSCEACLQAGASFDAFTNCQNEVKGEGICKSLQTQEQSSCQGIKDAGADTLKCFLGAGDTLETLFIRVEGIFCGP